MSKSKISKNEKMGVVQACAEVFQEDGKNRVYSDSLKIAAVQAYLSGKGSLRKIAAQYGITSKKFSNRG